MANPTTNFGWVMPTSTDLVTDLPADFAVFGQAVDTSMADLKGGTTGQILAKATNTDMDFTWITNDQGDITAVNTTAPLAGGGTSGALTLSIAAATTSVVGAVQLSDSTSTTSSVLAATPTAVKSAYDLADGAIAKSTVTTAGDIIYRNATVPTRLALGTANQVLRVNAGATAPEWATPAASASGLTLVSRQSYSNVANTGTTFDGVFTSTYRVYQIIVENHYAATPNDAFQFIYRYGTTDATGHNGNNLYATPGTSTTGAGTSSAAAFNVNIASGSSTYPFVAQMIVHNVGTGSGLRSQIYGQGFENNNTRMFSFGGYVDSAQNMTGFKIKSASSNITGTISVYGLAI